MWAFLLAPSAPGDWVPDGEISTDRKLRSVDRSKCQKVRAGDSAGGVRGQPHSHSVGTGVRLSDNHTRSPNRDKPAQKDPMVKGMRSHRRGQREKRVLRQTTMKAGSTCLPPAATSSPGGVQERPPGSCNLVAEPRDGCPSDQPVLAEWNVAQDSRTAPPVTPSSKEAPCSV